MNNKLVLGMLLALVGIGAGCSQEPSEATTPPVEEEAKLLASLTLDNGHVVDFKQAQAGFVFMTETGKQTGQGPALSDEVTQGKTFSQIY
ncbi:MAG: hypothetical protein JWN04_3194, partial [Myxococcaceae bacterium]|nr:hypothetical protein [Myxococcaceae bacterium]